MKKIILSSVLAVLLAGTARGVDFSMSAGAGGFIGGHFTRYFLEAAGNVSGNDVTVFSRQDADQLIAGGFLFFDAAWAEVHLGVLIGPYTYAEKTHGESKGSEVFNMGENTGSGREAMLDLSLLGKYPFELNSRFTVFPALGIDYRIALQELRKPEGRKLYDRVNDPVRHDTDSNGKPYPLSAWNALFIVLGGGLDFQFYSPFFLRAELLYSIRLPTPWESDGLEKLKTQMNAPNPVPSGLSSGPTLKIAAGWRFF